MGVMGALHQFTPVVTQRPLRSVWLARATFVTWLGAAWLIPFGVGVQREWLVEAGGGLAGTAVTLLAVNLSAPLAARGKGYIVTGLRFAVAGFAVTACFGVTYVADRQRELVRPVRAHRARARGRRPVRLAGAHLRRGGGKAVADVLPGARTRPASARAAGGLAGSPRGIAAVARTAVQRGGAVLDRGRAYWRPGWSRTWYRWPRTSGTGGGQAGCTCCSWSPPRAAWRRARGSGSPPCW